MSRVSRRRIASGRVSSSSGRRSAVGRRIASGRIASGGRVSSSSRRSAVGTRRGLRVAHILSSRVSVSASVRASAVVSNNEGCEVWLLFLLLESRSCYHM